MALQGTLDTFALPDVLRLLAVTKKSGRLRITGARGTGSVWVDDGGIGTIEAPHAPHATDPVDALFELLRFDQGSFTFDAHVAQESSGASGDLEALLAAAEVLLVEWSEIESVVPSLDAWVRLRRDLGSPKVTIDRSHWTMLVAVGSGVTVGRMSEEMCLAELHVSRAVRDLFELGLVDIEASAPAGQAPPDTPHPGEQPAPAAVAEIHPPLVDAPVMEVPMTPAPAPASAPEDEGSTDAPLPDARPIRARRAEGAAHLAEPIESGRFVPLELPGHSLQGSYDPIDGEQAGPVTGAEPADVAELAAAFPGLANRPADAMPDDAVLDAPEVEPGEEGSASRGRRLRFLSSTKS